MPGRFAFGSPCWYALAIDPTAIGARTSTVCHHGAMGSLVSSVNIVPGLADIIYSFLLQDFSLSRTGFSPSVTWPTFAHLCLLYGDFDSRASGAPDCSLHLSIVHACWQQRQNRALPPGNIYEGRSP